MLLKSKIALKRLTASDLTLFEWHFKNRNAGNQKAINLNRKVFIDKLYPSVPEAIQERGGRIPLDLTIFGPGIKPSINLQRKIIKFKTYKNWRLDGEFIYNPAEDPERFNKLRDGDFALIEFSGAVIPVSSRLYLIGRDYPDDVNLYAALDHFLADKGMETVNNDMLEEIVKTAAVTEDHPIYGLILGDALEEAALGGAEGMERLWSKAVVHHLSPEAFQKAKRNAENVGFQGEEYTNIYFEELQKSKKIKAFTWVSIENAIAPYDFTVIQLDGSSRFVDVKSTTRDFRANIHISLNELRSMAHENNIYDIYRVFSISESSAKLKIASDMKDFAQKVLSVLENLPLGTMADGISVKPDILSFSDEITISISPELSDE